MEGPNGSDWAPFGPGWTRGTLTSDPGPFVYRWVILCDLPVGTRLADLYIAMSGLGRIQAIKIRHDRCYVRYLLESEVVAVEKLIHDRGGIQIGNHWVARVFKSWDRNIAGVSFAPLLIADSSYC